MLLMQLILVDSKLLSDSTFSTAPFFLVNFILVLIKFNKKAAVGRFGVFFARVLFDFVSGRQACQMTRLR